VLTKWSENLKERDHLRDVGVDGRLILNWILKKYTLWCEPKWPMIGSSGGVL
jgi:hypothetical protein